MFDDISAFVGGVLDQRSAGNIADDVAARNVGHELFVARGHRSRLDDLRGVNDDAGLGIYGTGDLARGVFHALSSGDGCGNVINHRQYVMWAGIDARLTADATIRNHNRVRKVRSIGVVFLQQLFR